MAGILIYTAAPDSEGTLGGLVSLGETQELGRHLRAAFKQFGVMRVGPAVRRKRAGTTNPFATRLSLPRLSVRA
jgi:hypothetical protein